MNSPDRSSPPLVRSDGSYPTRALAKDTVVVKVIQNGVTNLQQAATVEAGLRAVGLAEVSLTSTHTVADGMHSVIVKATKPADSPAFASARATELPVPVASGCCGGEGCC